jgi:hypothetical protein
MGYDAYHLVAPLFAARNGAMPEIDGATGVLFLDANGRVHRRLAWAEFRRGEPVPLPEPGDPGSPLQTTGEDDAVLSEDPDEGQTWYEETREL